MITENKTKGITLNYTNFLDGNPVCYMMNFSDTIAKARFNEVMENMFPYEENMFPYEREQARYYRLVVFNEGDIYIDVNETGKMFFLCRFGNMLSSMTKEKLENLLNGMFQ